MLFNAPTAGSEFVDHVIRSVEAAIGHVLVGSEVKYRTRRPVGRRHRVWHCSHERSVQVKIGDAGAPRHRHLQYDPVAEERVLRPLQRPRVVRKARYGVVEEQVTSRHLGQEVEQVMSADILYIEGIPRCRRIRRPLRKTVS